MYLDDTAAALACLVPAPATTSTGADPLGVSRSNLVEQLKAGDEPPVRTGSWQKQHVPGAKNLDPATFGADDLPANKQATLVFYCSGPM